MGIFGNLFTGKQKDKQIKSLVANLQRINNSSLFGNAQAFYPTWDISKVSNRYCDTDDIYSIINKLASASSQIPLYTFYEKNKNATKQLKAWKPKDTVWQQKVLQLKALDDANDNDPVLDLLENPSDTLSKYEFYEAVYAMLYLHGEVLIYKERGEVRNLPRKLHVLQPHHVVINVTSSFPQTVTSYKYTVNGVDIMPFIPVEDIIHIRYFNPNFSINGGELRGLSPLKVLSKRMARMDAEMNASTAQLQNGGVPGIVYDKSAVTEEDVTRIGQHKDNFYRYLRNPGNVGSPYFAGGELGYLPLGLKLADLDVAALDKIDFKKLCNAYRVSDRLFNNDATGSEVSDNNAHKSLYTDAAVPNAMRVAAAFEMSLNEDFTDKRRVIIADVSEIPILQGNMKDLAEWLAMCPYISWNEKRELMKFDKSVNPVFDSYIIPTGLQLIDDLTAIPDLVNPINDYGANT